jgi:hypothetical protein
VPIPSNLPFPTTRCLKTPDSKRGVLSPLSVLLWWPRVPLRYPLPNKDLMLVKVTESFWVFLSLLLHLVPKPRREFLGGVVGEEPSQATAILWQSSYG